MRITALVWPTLILVAVAAGHGPADDKDGDAKKIQGTWVVDPATFKGVEDKEALKEALKAAESVRFVFAGDTFTLKHPPANEEKGGFRLDPTKTPKQIDMTDSARGIYELDGDTLKLCWDQKGKENGRPTKFAHDKDKATVHYFVLKREKPAAPPGREERKEAAPDPLVGVWEPTDVKGENPPLALPVEFSTGGEARYAGAGAGTPWGRYSHRGDRLEVTETAGGKEVTHAYAVEKLTAAELVLAFDGGKKRWAFKRAAPPGGEEKKEDTLDPAALVGKWAFAEGTQAGEKVAAKKADGDLTFTFTKDTVTLEGGGDKFVMKYKIDASKTPARIDLEATGGLAAGSKGEGIIALDGGTLKLAYVTNTPEGKRPEKFESSKDNKASYSFVLKKAK